MTEFYKIINKFGMHSCRTFSNRQDAQIYAESLNQLHNMGWRVVAVWG